MLLLSTLVFALGSLLQDGSLRQNGVQGTPVTAAVPLGAIEIGVTEASLPASGLVPDLERGRKERREAFLWIAPDVEGTGTEVVGALRREVLRIGPGEWRVQVRERWGDGELETHSVERLGFGRERRLVERELRSPDGRTVFARWSSAAVDAPVEGALRVTTSGEGRPTTSIVPAAAGRTALGRPALVELLRRDRAPARCLALEPYSGRFEAARILSLRGLPGFPGMRLAFWFSEEPGREGELCRWWVFSGAELLSFGGPAGTARAVRTRPGNLPPGL